MIAHVAEAGENRGRVVVRLGAFTRASAPALSAAVHVAAAFGSEIEGLFIEDGDLFMAAAHPGVREMSVTGQPRAGFSAERLAGDIGHFAVAAQREVADAARAEGIGFSARIVRDTLNAALADACAVRGPWNVIAFAEPIAGAEQGAALAEAISKVWGTTGYVAAGSRARWRGGPVVVALEDVERTSGLVRAAERLAAVAGDAVILVPVAADEIAGDWLEGEVRLALGEQPRLTLAPRPAECGSPAGLRSALTAYRPRLILARHGGIVVPAEATADALAGLDCPVFLVH